MKLPNVSLPKSAFILALSLVLALRVHAQSDVFGSGQWQIAGQNLGNTGASRLSTPSALPTSRTCTPNGCSQRLVMFLPLVQRTVPQFTFRNEVAVPSRSRRLSFDALARAASDEASRRPTEVPNRCPSCGDWERIRAAVQRCYESLKALEPYDISFHVPDEPDTSSWRFSGTAS